jgi:hypothetical protein
MLKKLVFLTIIVLKLSKMVMAINPPTLSSPINGETSSTLTGFLSLNNVSDATGYQYQYDTSSNFSSPLNTIDTSIYSVFWTEPLYKGKTYYWRARAYMPGDTSIWSSTASFKAPVNMGGLNAPANNGIGEIQYFICNYMSSLGNPKITYLFEADTSSSFNTPNKIFKSQAGTQFADTGLFKFGRTVYWRATATNSLGDTLNWSETRKFTFYSQAPAPLTGSTNHDPETFIAWPDTKLAGVLLEADTVASFSSSALFQKNVPSGVKVDTLKNLYFGKKYFCRIRAKYGSSISALSTVKTLTVNDIIPSSLKPYTGSTNNSLLPTFEWKGMRGVNTQFQLFSDSLYQNVLKDTILKSAPHTNTYQSWQALDFSQKYYFRVRYMHVLDTTKWANSWFSTEDGVMYLSSPANNLLNADVRLRFEFFKKTWATGYILQIDTGTQFGQSLSPLAIVETSFLNSGSFVSYKDTTLRYGQNYVGRVIAIKGLDTAKAFLAKRFTTAAKPEPYFPSNNFIGIGTSTNGLVTGIKGSNLIQWELDTSELFQSSEYQTGINNHVPNSFNPNYISLTFPNNRLFHSTYFWRARCINTLDTSDWSSVYNFVTTTEARTENPLDKALNVSVNPILEWNIQGSVNQLRFQYQIRKDSLFDNIGIVTIPAGESPIDTIDCDYATKYYWRGRAFHSRDTSRWSQITTFTTIPAPVLTAPSLISPANGQLNVPIPKVDLFWTAVKSATSYDVQTSTDESFSQILAQGNNPANSGFFSGINPKTKYYWRVRAKAAQINGPWSAISWFQTAPPIGINTINNQLAAQVYPNPANEKVIISTLTPSITDIYDMKGSLVFKSDNAELSHLIDTHSWPLGLYQIKIIEGNKESSQRLLIER